MTIVIAVSGYCLGQSGNQQLPFKIQIHLRESKIKLGTPVVLDVQVLNNTGITKQISVSPGITFADGYYTAMVLDETGQAMPETAYGERIHGRGDDPRAIGGGSHFGVPIEPGGHIDQEFRLSYLYKLTKPGVYSIQLLRDDLIGKGETIKSNTVVLTITP
jgi:hypothetical protein